MATFAKRQIVVTTVLFLLVLVTTPRLLADTQFVGWNEIPGHSTTATSDAATTYQNHLYLFGIGINDHAHYVNVFDGSQWSGWKLVPGGGTTNLADAATTLNGKLYLFGIGINDHAHYVNVFDGSQWSGWKLVPGGGTTNLADAATTLNGKLYLFGIGINDHAHYVNVFDGSQWSGWKLVPGGGTTNLADAATTLNGKLYLFGIGINDHAHYVNVFDGSQWSGWKLVPGGGTTNLADAATTLNGKLYLFGIGINDHAHYVNVFDASQWSGWKLVQGGGTTNLSDTPSSLGNILYLFAVGGADRRHYVNSATPNASSRLPRYNEVYQKNTHNSYWINAFFDPEASGTQERLVDQILHEAVRSVELDLHFEGGHPGEFTIYHTVITSDSTCHYLTDCLDLLHRLDYLQPAHEVITVILEFKEAAGVERLFGDNGVRGPLKHNHHIEDLDRQIYEHLGARLFTPRELLSNPQCQGLTLRACVGKVGWPTLEQLRGRFIITVIGNWADNYWDWIEYANDDGGIGVRVAFPMRSMLVSQIDNMKCGTTTLYPYPRQDSLKGYDYHPEIELNASSLCANGDHPYVFDHLDDANFKQRLGTAREASVFWQVEDRGFENPQLFPLGDPDNANTFLDTSGSADNLVGNGVVRIGDQGQTMFQPANQLALIKQGPPYQIFQTDFPWNFIHSRQPNAATSFPVPDRPMFQAKDVVPSVQPTFDAPDFNEPGARLYFHGRPQHGPVYALLDVNGDTDWEVQAANTAPSHDNMLPPRASVDSFGCLIAQDLGGSNGARLCRTQTSQDSRQVLIAGWAIRNGVRSDFSYLTTNQEPQMTDIGDLLRMQVINGGKTVRFLTAGTIAPNGAPRWNPLQIGDLNFSVALGRQGLNAQGDVLFVTPKLNGTTLRKGSFTSWGSRGSRGSNETSGYIEDLSQCVDGGCSLQESANRAETFIHEDVFVSSQGAHYVGVHETEGKVFAQWRTLFTSDLFEMTNSGLYQFQRRDKFLLLKDSPAPGAPMTALYKCWDLRRDYHQYWLSIDRICSNPNTNDPFGENAGRIGYIATSALPGTQPLWHLRKGTQNAGSADTHDHYFALGDAERDVKKDKEGYEIVGSTPVGWVYTKTTLP